MVLNTYKIKALYLCILNFVFTLFLSEELSLFPMHFLGDYPRLNSYTRNCKWMLFIVIFILINEMYFIIMQFS